MVATRKGSAIIRFIFLCLIISLLVAVINFRNAYHLELNKVKKSGYSKDKYSKVNKIEETEYSKDEWRKMLSFISLNHLGACEYPYMIQNKTSFQNVTHPYYERVKMHNEKINRLVKKLKLAYCMMGCSASYQEETYAMIFLARWTVSYLNFCNWTVSSNEKAKMIVYCGVNQCNRDFRKELF